MKRLITYILVLMISSSLIADSDLHVLFDSANKAYTQQDFFGAIQKYEEILDKGVESEAVYFNLGNAYYKNGKLDGLSTHRNRLGVKTSETNYKNGKKWEESNYKNGKLNGLIVKWNSDGTKRSEKFVKE